MVIKPGILAVVLISAVPVFSQGSRFDLERTLRFDDPSQTKRKVEKFVREHQGTPTALFLAAALEKDAQAAVDKYIRLFSKYPKSNEAEEARFRVAQYYFSRGLYIAARKYFLGLVEKYPNSEFVDDSMYLAASCLAAAKNLQAVRKELQVFVAQHSQSPYARLAKEELKELKPASNAELLKLTSQESNGKYVLQIGAFSRINNALNLRSQFTKVGLPVEINEKKQGNRTVYSVTIGAFLTKADAENFGIKFKKQYAQPYRIIRKQ